MNEIDVIKYIREWLILKNLSDKKIFDCIIYENLPEEQESEYKNMNISTLDKLWYDFSINWKLISKLEKHENILIVLDKLNINYLTPFIKKAKEKNKNFTIINLWAWISSALNKKIIEADDISSLLNYDIEIKESYDFITFFSFLSKKWQKYIRIPQKTLVWNIAKDEDASISNDESIISLREYWLMWDNWTILIWASILQDSIQFTEILRGDWKNYDVFAVLDYNFKLKNEILESLQRTEKLIIIVDQLENLNLINKIKSQLWDIWMIDLKIATITPDRSISTQSEEYIRENTKFDAKWILEKITKI